MIQDPYSIQIPKLTLPQKAVLILFVIILILGLIIQLTQTQEHSLIIFGIDDLTKIESIPR